MSTKDTTSTSNKAGLPPGTLMHIGIKKTEKVKVSVVQYSVKKAELIECENPEDCFPFKSKRGNSWINISGLHDVQTIQAIGKKFGLDNLLLEDILNTKNRPKASVYPNYTFFTLKMLGTNKDGRSINSEQISFVLGKGWLLSFQEKDGDLFDNIRSRIMDGNAKLRNQGVDYLFLRCIDTIIDNYFYVSEFFTDKFDRLEERVLKYADKKQLVEIQQRKRMLRNFRKAVFPVREGLNIVQKDRCDLINNDHDKYIEDIYGHHVQLSENIDNLKENLGAIMDLYHTEVANRMNQIMQVLTIISTIFVPLTFIAGIYGMNFEIMPELQWEYGYLTVWVVMILIIVGLLYFFRRKRWL